ncbi:DUF305 domain-containing protein [Nocardioides sp.]|uniref:DUF305 domain-containing protein n=1 Tax=Nocardioides sp. TaxID=35761 RepID=UPI003518DAB1
MTRTTPFRLPARRLGTALVLTAALALGATGCGDAEPAGSSATSTTEHSAQDVAFATQMIPHHAQALSLVDLTLDRDLTPAVATLAEQIRTAQAPEIEQMVDWLQAWGEPIPATMRDHVNAGDHAGHSMDGMSGMDGMEGMEGMDSSMPGMLSGEELDALAAAGTDFEQRWLEAMIAHHRGAIEMAQTEVEDGTYAPAVDLARQIIEGQQAEIATMEDLLAQE